MLSIFKKKKPIGKNKQLDEIIQGIEMNQSNNYKDAAQQGLKELEAGFEELKASGKLSEKQVVYYEERLETFRKEMKEFTHKDQKPYWV